MKNLSLSRVLFSLYEQETTVINPFDSTRSFSHPQSTRHLEMFVFVCSNQRVQVDELTHSIETLFAQLRLELDQWKNDDSQISFVEDE